MKNIFSIFAIFFAVIITSCEQETQIEVNKSSDLTINLNAQNSSSFNPNPCCGEENLFERQLHWFSYLAAEIFTTTPAVRSEINLLLADSGGIYIPAEDLIGDGSQAPIFNQAFYDRLVWYFDDWTGWPGSSNTTPNFPPGTGGSNGSTPGSTLANQYYSIILDANCVELYFPRGLDFKLTNPSTTSTAHPLTTSGANEGILFTYSPAISNYTSSVEVIDDNYVLSNKNIMVARPHKYDPDTSIIQHCAYELYGTINFMDFLD